MAEPTESYPESATNAARKASENGDGKTAIDAALASNGAELAALLERTDELEDVLTTAILVAASADEDELEQITDSTANLVEAADGLTTDEAAELATTLGENAEEMGEVLDTVVRLQREGHLDDLVTVATALTESLSPAEIDELAAGLAETSTDAVEALDVILELQREGHLEDIVALAKMGSALDLDEDAVNGLNAVLGAVGEAEERSEPVGPLGAVWQLRGRDARAGLGYVVALLKGLGRRRRGR